MITVKIEISRYNTRRYGKPWGANITFAKNKPVYDFTGHYDGDQLLIDAEPGSIIAFGKKDFRKPMKSEKDFAIVTGDGGYQIVTEGQAREAFLAARAGAAA